MFETPEIIRIVEIAADPGRVRAILLDVERWPDWTTTMIRVSRTDSGPFAVGTRARVQQPGLRPALWEVSALDQRGFTWVSRSPGIEVAASHAVEASAEGSRVTLAIRFSGFLAPLVGRLTGRTVRRYLDIEADGLKACAEAGNP